MGVIATSLINRQEKKGTGKNGLSSAAIARINAQYLRNQEEERAQKSQDNGEFWGGLGYLGEKVAVGLMSSFEGLIDYSVGGLAKLFGNDDWAEELFQNDWFGDWYSHPEEWYNPSDGWKVAGDVAGGIGTSLPATGAAFLTALTGGAAAAPAVAGIVGGLGAAGNATKQAYQETGELGAREFGYGALSGITEGALEGVSGALGTGTGQIIKGISQSFAKEGAKTAAKTIAKQSIVKTLGKGFLGEAFEEGMSEFLDPYYQRATYNQNAENASLGDIGYAAFVGGMSGMIMSEAVPSIRSGTSFLKGNNLVGRGLDTEVLGLSGQLAEFENVNKTGDESFEDIANTYDELTKSLETTGGKITTVAQKKMLGELYSENTRAIIKPLIARRAANIVNNADAIVEWLNQYGYKTADGKPITLTAEQLREGIVSGDGKSFAKALKKNSALRELAIADALGHLIMDTARFEQATLKGTQLASRVDLNRFIEKATASEIASVSSALGIEDLSTITAEEFNQKIIDFVQSGGAQLYADRRGMMQRIQAIPESAAQKMPRAVHFEKDGTVRYSDEATKIAITKQGDTYTIYDYTSGLMTKNMTESEVNQRLRAYSAKRTDLLNEKRATAGKRSLSGSVDNRIKSGSSINSISQNQTDVNSSLENTPKQDPRFLTETERFEQFRRQTAEIDAYARENLEGYGGLSDAGKSMIRKLIRDGRANGVAEDVILSAARVSARSGLDIVFSKEGARGGDGRIEGNTVYIDPTASGERIRSKLLLHEVGHAIVRSKKGKRLIAEAFKQVSPERAQEVAERYQKLYEPQSRVVKEKGKFSRKQVLSTKEYISIINEEIAMHHIEDVLGNANAWEYILSKEQTMGQRFLSFFKGASEAYSADRKLSRTARKLLRTYKRLFDEFAARNQGSNGVDAAAVSFMNSEKMHDTGKRFALEGRTEDGRGIYRTNYPENTPKTVKQKDIVNLVQNVWSKKPIRLNLILDGEEHPIEAKFNPELSERSDLAKIAFGNRKGTASEKRITMNLSSDLYQIAEESHHVGSKIETGKINSAHSGVSVWHYFLTDLVYVENDGTRIECYMNIDVKQNDNGHWFYSFAIEKGSRPTDVLSAVTDKSATTSTNSISQTAPDVNTSSKNNSDERMALRDIGSQSQITVSSTDHERYSALKDRKLSLSAQTNTEKLDAVMKKFDITQETFDYSAYGDRSRLFKKIGEEFGLYKRYSNSDVKLKFAFSKSNMAESISKQKRNYYRFAKLLSCFDAVVENAVGIEVHNRNADGYKIDAGLKQCYVLASAFVDGENIVPVKLEVKDFIDKGNTLHIAIALESIQKDEGISARGHQNGVAQQYRPSSAISIADFFAKINPSDESFYKYIPKEFLGQKADTSDVRYALPEKNSATENFDADAIVARGVPQSASGDTLTVKDPYSYEALISKPDLSVVKVNNNVPKNEKMQIDYKAVVARGKINARGQGNARNTTTDTYVYVDDIGIDVLLGSKGLQHGLVRSEETALAVMKIGDILKNSIAVNELDGSLTRKTNMSYVLLGAFQDNKNLYAVRSVVSKPQSDVIEIDAYQLSAVKGKKTETPNSALKRGAAVTEQSSLISSESPTISIADFLQYVKDIPLINEIVSQDVAKKLGVNRSNGTLTGDLRYALPENNAENNRNFNSNATKFDVKQTIKQGAPLKRKAGVTAAQLEKILADYTKERVYSKKDAAQIVKDFEGVEGLSNKKIEELSGALWQVLNQQPEGRERKYVAHRMAEFVTAKIIADTKDEHYSNASADQISDIVEKIEETIIEAYKSGGRESKFSNIMGKDYRYWKAEYERLKGRNEIIGNLMSKAEKIKETEYGTFENATQYKLYKPGVFKSSVMRLANIQFRGNLNVSGTRRIIGNLRSWYQKENPMLGYIDEEHRGYYAEEVAEKMDAIANGEGVLTTEDLSDLYDIMSWSVHLVETWNKVWRQGKWIDAEPLARQYVDILKENEQMRSKVFSKLTGSIYAATFFEPMSVARRMDVYREGGFFTQTVQSLRDAGIAAQIAEMEVRSPYDAFNSEYKKYIRTATKETVEYRGVRMSKMHLMSLYMTMKRDDFYIGLARNGFAFVDNAGKTIRVDGLIGQDADITFIDALKCIKEQRRVIKKMLTDTDRKYIKILERIYNEDLRRLKVDRDMQRLGYTNVKGGYYYPGKRAFMSKKIGAPGMPGTVDRSSRASFNRSTVKGASQELLIESADVVFNRHVQGVCLYAYLSPEIENYNLLYHLDVGGNTGNSTSVKTASQNTWSRGEKYLSKLIADLQRISATPEEGKKIFAFLRRGYVKSQLGANPKVWGTQLSSLFASLSILDGGSILRGVSVSSKDVDKYCSLAKLRSYDNTAAMAQGVLDRGVGRALRGVNRFSDALMAPIGKMDQFVVGRLFGACQVQVSKRGGPKIGTEENKIAAGKLLREVILETQQNSAATERSAAMRSGNEIMRTITMFSADGMKVIGRVIDSYGELSALHQRKKMSTDPKVREGLDGKIKTARRKFRKSVMALASTAAFGVAIAQFFKRIYDKERDEDENIHATMALDWVGNLFGGLPIVKDIWSRFTDGYELDNYAYSAVNDLLNSAKDVLDMAGGIFGEDVPEEERNRALRNLAYSTGQILGIPTRNVYNMLYGLTKRFDPNTAYKIDSAFYKKNYQKDLYEAIENEDADRVTMIMEILLGERLHEDVDEAVFDELLRLSQGGAKVLPKAVPVSITRNREKYTLSTAEQGQIKQIYTKAEDTLKALFARAGYKALSDELRAEAVNYVYDLYYDIALQETLGINEGSKTLLISDIVGIQNLALLSAKTKGLQSDTDKQGNTVSGSRRKKVIAAINSLGIKTETKLLLICAKGYTLQDGDIRGLSAKTAKQKLLRYILSLKGVSQAQKIELATMCGFEVKNGKIITKTAFS